MAKRNSLGPLGILCTGALAQSYFMHKPRYQQDKSLCDREIKVSKRIRTISDSKNLRKMLIIWQLLKINGHNHLRVFLLAKVSICQLLVFDGTNTLPTPQISR